VGRGQDGRREKPGWPQVSGRRLVKIEKRELTEYARLYLGSRSLYVLWTAQVLDSRRAQEYGEIGASAGIGIQAGRVAAEARVWEAANAILAGAIASTAVRSGGTMTG
jgi:hypothetical protein